MSQYELKRSIRKNYLPIASDLSDIYDISNIYNTTDIDPMTNFLLLLFSYGAYLSNATFLSMQNHRAGKIWLKYLWPLIVRYQYNYDFLTLLFYTNSLLGSSHTTDNNKNPFTNLYEILIPVLEQICPDVPKQYLVRIVKYCTGKRRNKTRKDYLDFVYE